jgi:L-alanine-DL-glutamate epimerase-like enolase superfamily enzyme
MHFTRRQFLGVGAAVPFANALDDGSPFARISEGQRNRVTIRDVQVMLLEGGRTYTLVKVVADDGLFGIGEAYGSPGIGVKEQVLGLREWLIGRDPLQIDVLYTTMGRGSRNLSGTRTDGSAHNLIRAVSGIEMALWDLAGKMLGVPTSTLLGGAFRDRVRVYDHARPANLLDRSSVTEWAARVRSNPSGFTCHKFGLPRTTPATDLARDPGNRSLTTRELIETRQGFENCREALGWDHDLMVHCHWEFNLPTAVQIAEAIQDIKPVWLEDPLPVDYTDAWKRLCESTSVPICMGENLARREGFKDFIINHGADILHPDLRNSGGFLETKRIADMAHVFGLPMALHNTASQVHTYSAAQWAASVRDWVALETVTGQGGWMDDVLILDGPYIQDGFIRVSERPGLGIVLNPDVVQAHLAEGEAWWG